MGKRRRENEAHAGQDESKFNDESKVDSMNVEGEKKNQRKKKNEVAGKSKEKKGGISVQSGGKIVFSWTAAQEIMVLKELVKLAKMDTSKPLDNSGINWEVLAVAVGERLDQSVTRTQIYEKTRRLKERYLRNEESMSRGKFSSFKNKDDEKMFKFSQKVWGVCGSPDLQRNEKNRNFPAGDFAKEFNESNQSQSRGRLFNDAEVQKTEKEQRSEDLGRAQSYHNKPEQLLDNAVNTFNEDGSDNNSHEQGLTNAGNVSNEQTKPVKAPGLRGEGKSEFLQQRQTTLIPSEKVASHSSNHEGGEEIKRIMDGFYSEHQALLEDVQKSCMTVLEDMEAKFLSILSNIVRGMQSAWMGVGAHISSVDMMLQDLASWDSMIDRCASLSTANAR
ncbi:hypothetical protein GOP47_0010445 [Adiantum capillus-veneris]|uniref:Glabrous enhancer-binding protein-like DBD domain-containing protein n=1 Tax=Adiantum capillus-veneris TaxID=13818 RepID=A0A9D4ZGE3_ADICA|nr:hypothetical protein GOP47_0010445 [Adiantum capillus-veneris]